MNYLTIILSVVVAGWLAVAWKFFGLLKTERPPSPEYPVLDRFLLAITCILWPIIALIAICDSIMIEWKVYKLRRKLQREHNKRKRPKG